MSSDDVVALVYLLRHPQIEVVGIGSANGVAHVGPAARNVLRLLALVGREDVPVAVGSETALEGNNNFPPGWRGTADSLFGLDVPAARAQPVPESTADLLAKVVNARPGELVVVLLGAHTDLATALRKDPSLAKRIRGVHMMGGAVRVSGNINLEYGAIANKVAEWNLWLDYRAAAEVFQAGIPMRVVPLDATNQVRVDRAYYDRFAAAATSAVAKTLVQLWKSQLGNTGQGFYIWDAVAAVTLPAPQMAQWEPLALAVATEPADKQGQTTIVSGKPANAQMCGTVDVVALQQELLRVCNR